MGSPLGGQMGRVAAKQGCREAKGACDAVSLLPCFATTRGGRGDAMEEQWKNMSIKHIFQK